MSTARPRSLTQVVRRLDAAARNGDADRPAVFPTGFAVLDHVLEGGLRAGDLTLVGGAPGVGKTVATLQWARHMAMRDTEVVYACYEHGERSLLVRLLQLELGETVERPSPETGAWLRRAVRAVGRGDAALRDIVAEHPDLEAAFERLSRYGDRLHLVRASAGDGLPELHDLAATIDGGGVLFVDYLQKVAVGDATLRDEDRAIRAAEGLKDIALTHNIAVVACAAGDRGGLRARRMRTRNLRGAGGLAYEADLILLLNDKFDAVSKLHTAFDSARAEQFRRQVVFSVEKNREGPAAIDVEFWKDFEHFRFEPEGAHVAERLIDDRLYVE